MWITNITFYVDFELYEDGLSLKKIIINLVKIGQMFEVEFKKVGFCLKTQSKINIESDSYKQYKK